ncbi:MAG: hypothetical protein LAT61_03850 [Alcanivorax sp.]|nr:hypothetical protein [Alcanivorax sp.]
MNGAQVKQWVAVRASLFYQYLTISGIGISWNKDASTAGYAVAVDWGEEMVIRIQLGPRRDRCVVGAVLGGLICAGLSGFGFFIVISGATLSGGIPLVPDDLNQAIGRGIFGVGAVLTSGLAGYAFYDAWRLVRERRGNHRPPG